MRGVATPVAAGVFICGLALLAGCAATPPAGDLEERPPGLPAAAEIAEAPFFAREDYQCGPAALAMALTHAGRAVAPDALVPQVYLPARKGSLQVELMAATRRAGRIAYPVESTPEALVAELVSGRPVLVLQNLFVRTVPRWHYAVLVGADPESNRFILNSGERKGLPVRASSFLRTWNWADRWGMVALRPGELPARADPTRYLSAVAEFESVAGVARARSAYRAAAQRWPHDPRVHLALGNQAYADDRKRSAAKHYRTGLRHAPGDAVLANNLASVLGELGCVQQAREVLDSVEADTSARWQQQLARTRRELDALPRQDSRQCTVVSADKTPD